MGTNAVQRDATAETVSANVKRLRTKQNLGLRGLSTKLGEVGRPLGHSAIDQIEKGTRRVDVDDLMALAVALEVSPSTLLMPNAENAEDQVYATGWEHAADAAQVWGWLQTDVSLGWRDRPDISAERALPAFLYRELMEEKAARLPELKARFEERKRTYGGI